MGIVRRKLLLVTIGTVYLCVYGNRELKQQQRRRLRNRDLKSEFALPQTLSRLFHLVQFVKCWQFFSGVKFCKAIEVEEKKK